MGPFTEAPNNPIPSTDVACDITSPGHHAIFRSGGKTYVLYHRQALPWHGERPETLRQMAVDALHVRADGLLDVVRPTHGGVRVAGWAGGTAQGVGVEGPGGGYG